MRSNVCKLEASRLTTLSWLFGVPKADQNRAQASVTL